MPGVPQVHFVRGPGGSVAYQVWGGGDRDVLFMPEWATSVDAAWEHPGRIRILGFHGSIGRAVRFDRRGVGASDPLPVERVGDLGEWADDALLVLDAVGAERVVLSAEGWAAQVGILLAVRHPERIERLALLNGFARLTKTTDYEHGLPETQVPGLVELVSQSWGTGQITKMASETLAVGALDPGFLGRTERLAAGPTFAAATIEAMYRSDVRSLLPQVEVPTLVIYTGDLGYVGPEHCEFLAARIPGAKMIHTQSKSFYWGDAGFTEFGRFLSGRPDYATDRELASVLFTDIAGSTHLANELGDTRWRELLDNIDGFVSVEINRLGGRLVKQTGDGHLATFPTPRAAIEAGINIVTAAPGFDVSIRAGVHTGEVERRLDDDIGGIAVHVAHRVAALAVPGEVLVSRTVADLVAGSDFLLESRGEHELRGLPHVWQLFAVGLGGAAA